MFSLQTRTDKSLSVTILYPLDYASQYLIPSILYYKLDFLFPKRPKNVDYYTFNSLSLFWLAESVQWIFEISAWDVI